VRLVQTSPSSPTSRRFGEPTSELSSSHVAARPLLDLRHKMVERGLATRAAVYSPLRTSTTIAQNSRPMHPIFLTFADARLEQQFRASHAKTARRLYVSTLAVSHICLVLVSDEQHLLSEWLTWRTVHIARLHLYLGLMFCPPFVLWTFIALDAGFELLLLPFVQHIHSLNPSIHQPVVMLLTWFIFAAQGSFGKWPAAQFIFVVLAYSYSLYAEHMAESTFPVPSLYLPCTFPVPSLYYVVPSLYLPCTPSTWLRWSLGEDALRMPFPDGLVLGVQGGRSAMCSACSEQIAQTAYHLSHGARGVRFP